MASPKPDINSVLKPKEFRFVIHSMGRSLTALAVIAPALFYMTYHISVFDGATVITIIKFLAVVLLSFFLANLTGRARVKIVFTRDGLSHIWERRFLFGSVKNIEVPWGLVEGYIFEQYKIFDSLTIKLTDGRRYKINRLYIPFFKDDFDKFYKRFPKLINHYSGLATPQGGNKKIERGKNPFTTKELKWLFITMATIFALIAVAYTIRSMSTANWINSIVIVCLLLVYSVMMIVNRTGLK